MKTTSPTGDALLLIIGILLVVGSVFAFLLQRNRQKSKFIAMRREQSEQKREAEAAANNPGVVRSTDVVRLSKENEAKRLQANAFIESGKIREGAAILEELGLQRYAINALESAHLIDEACAVLVRMNRPNRAGVVYQRNRMPLKAAEHFLTANLPEEAARCYLEAGATQPEMFRKAADIYESLGRETEALEAYRRGELTEAYVQFCLKHNCFDKLRDFLDAGKTVRAGFVILDMYSTKKLVKAIPLDTQTAQSLALWCRTVKRVELIEMSLRKLVDSKNLLSLFWSLLPEDFSGQIVTSLLSAPQFRTEEGKPLLLRNARALHDAKRHMQAGLLYEHTGRLAMAAKCQALAGDLGYSLDLLSQAEGEETLARDLLALLEPHSAAPRTRHAKFSGEIASQAIRLFAHIDADSDELHTHSPFSLTA